MKLSKTDFSSYLRCNKTFWLRRRRPGVIAWPVPSAMEQTRMRDGQAVEAVSRAFVEGHCGSEVRAQVTFQTDSLLARADFVRDHDDASVDIYEVKASTRVKDDDGNDHVVDAAFQLLTARRAGVKVRSINVVHLDSNYERRGALDVKALFKAVDVTQESEKRLEELETQIDAAAAYLVQEDIDLDGCDCRFKGAKKRCDAFDYLNPNIDADSAHFLPRITSKKLANWQPRFSLRDIDPAELNPHHQLIRKAHLDGTVINVAGIKGFVGKLKFPIDFYDYETTGPAIPPADGYRPYQALPVQFSLHRLHESGDLTHTEWLSENHGQQHELVDRLEEACRAGGSAVAWHKSFELGCNKRLAALLPDKADFLAELSERTLDLEDPFKSDYVDWAFKGSTSIKKVLPVLVPHLKYDASKVHDGTGAVEAWMRMIALPPGEERADLRGQLLEYCRLDTLAMVEIFRVLEKLVSEDTH